MFIFTFAFKTTTRSEEITQHPEKMKRYNSLSENGVELFGNVVFLVGYPL